MAYTQWLMVLGTLVFLTPAVMALIVGAAGLSNAANTAHVSVSLPVWLFVYGIVWLVAAPLMWLSMYLDDGNGGQVPWRTILNWIIGLLVLFIVAPWLIVGQVILLQGSAFFIGTSGQVAVAIVALVFSYIALLIIVARIGYVLRYAALVKR